MADKKNKILEEQRRAREEFLKLKKMQQGEISAGPKPSEVAILPKTPKEKLANFWFQYKWHTIAIVFSVIVIAVLVAQCANKTDYDLSVVYFTYTPVMDNQLSPVADYFEKISTDLNDDGEVNVQIVNCSFAENGNIQYRNSILTKLQAIMAADEKTLLFITDNKSIKYFENAEISENLFEGEPLLLSEDFYESTKTEDFGNLPEGLQVSCRRIANTLLEKNKDTEKVYKESKQIIEKLMTE